MALPVPQESLALIRRWEGLHKVSSDMVHPYPDVAHGWKVTTQGYGTTINPETRVKLNKSSPAISPQRANQWLALDLQRKYLPGVDRSVTRRLHPLSRGALGSFAYNVGTGAFRRSTLRKRINQGDLRGVAKEWRKWRMAGGRVYKGLVARREDELAMFMKGARLLESPIPRLDQPAAPQIPSRSFWRVLLDWFFGRGEL